MSFFVILKKSDEKKRGTFPRREYITRDKKRRTQKIWRKKKGPQQRLFLNPVRMSIHTTHIRPSRKEINKHFGVIFVSEIRELKRYKKIEKNGMNSI